MTRRMVILTEGYSNPRSAKTAANVIRYRPEEVLAVLDSTQVGRHSGELLQAGAVPFVARLADVPGADTLLIGIAPPGGRIPAAWRAIILEAIERGMNIVSGLHEFLTDDPEFVAAAAARKVSLQDVRRNHERDVATCLDLDDSTLRVLTVGHDCSVGKMVAAVELTRACLSRGIDAKFLATGQTGIMIDGDGVPIDCVVADFVNGAIEKLVRRHQHHDVLLIEGQGSLAHPAYSAVTLGLLHGCAPQAMIFVYEAGRTKTTSVEHRPIPPIRDIKRCFETMAEIRYPSRTIGFAINGRLLNDQQAKDERRRIEDEFGLPACDLFRDGPEVLVAAIEGARADLNRLHPRLPRVV
jgi:uncharacterized NAD-dependent epimerase/dehydratase family protein